MKKAILTVAAIILMVSNLSAQISNSEDSRDRVRFGAKIGLNLSNMYDSENDKYDSDPKVGLVGGAFVSIPLGKFIGVQPEVLFSQKGFKTSTTFLGSEYKFKRTTNYLDIPIFLALKPMENVTLLFGPQYSYLFKQKDVWDNPITGVVGLENDFENEDVRKNTFSVATGVDVNYGNFVLGVRVSWDLFNNNGDGTSNTPRYKNVWGGLTLGIRL